MLLAFMVRGNFWWCSVGQYIPARNGGSWEALIGCNSGHFLHGSKGADQTLWRMTIFSTVSSRKVFGKQRWLINKYASKGIRFALVENTVKCFKCCCMRNIWGCSLMGRDWLFTEEQLSDSPSRKDGIGRADEDRLRREGIKLIVEIGTGLKLLAFVLYLMTLHPSFSTLNCSIL